ncbi:MAG: CreA family protein [Alphaproteobacteria bacterium]|jgi:CreA protein|nr:CreA family protein [Alphaproteobacteria bacterium]
MKLAAPIIASVLAAAVALPALAQESDDPELLFKKTTVWRMLSPDAKLATYVLDDPDVKGVACYFTVPEIGGWSGWAGFAEERSETSLDCRQVGPIQINAKFEQGGQVYRQRRSLFFKKMQIVRGCDAKRNVLVYLAYTDKLIEGSPNNSTSTVPIMPWGDLPAPKCSDFVTP